MGGKRPFSGLMLVGGVLAVCACGGDGKDGERVSCAADGVCRRSCSNDPDCHPDVTGGAGGNSASETGSTGSQTAGGKGPGVDPVVVATCEDTTGRIATAHLHTCILLANGNVACYGENDEGESDPYTGGDAIAVAAGGQRTCILTADHNIRCTGRATADPGMLSPYQGGDAVGLDVGNSHQCALLNNGNVYCWGSASSDAVGEYAVGDAIGVAAGDGFTCVLTASGNARCWGDEPVDGGYNQGDAVAISANYGHVCVVRSNGSVHCWGRGDSGETTAYEGGDAVGVAAGDDHTCVLRSNGTVACYGSNTWGAAEGYAGGDAIGIRAASYQTCALLKEGNVECWGGASFMYDHGQYRDYLEGDAMTECPEVSIPSGSEGGAGGDGGTTSIGGTSTGGVGGGGTTSTGGTSTGGATTGGASTGGIGGGGTTGAGGTSTGGTSTGGTSTGGTSTGGTSTGGISTGGISTGGISTGGTSTGGIGGGGTTGTGGVAAGGGGGCLEDDDAPVEGPSGTSCDAMTGDECQGASCCTTLLVPAGQFAMGRSAEGCDANTSGASDEQDAGADPEHDVSVSSFYLDKYEVTVGRFRAFVESGAWAPELGAGRNLAVESSHPDFDTGWREEWTAYLPRTREEWDGVLDDCSYGTWTPTAGANESRPVNCVQWYEAQAFCIWDGGRLPTEAEWEYAAAGGDQNRPYPWGSEAPNCTLLKYWNCSDAGVDEVGIHTGVARWGHHDMGGNLWEWTFDAYGATWYDDIGASGENVCNLPLLSERSMRGGSFGDASGAEFRAANRAQSDDDTHGTYGFIGVRCAREP